MPEVHPLVRADLSRLPGYAPGRPARQPSGRSRSFKLSSNENPFPPAPAVQRAIHGASAANRYPDMAASALVDELAAALGVGTDQVTTGPGSVGVLSQVLQATCRPGDEVVVAWRSFEAYPIVAGVVGARVVQVPVTSDGRHDLEAMAEAVTERTRLVVVCSPNNPTGPAVHADELDGMLGRLQGRVLVALDEAYVEFVRDPAAADGVRTVQAWPNVVVLRTFSKAHGLAALRVGYGVGSPEVVRALRATAVPFGVSAVAQAAAVAALRSADDVDRQVAAIVAERRRVADELARLGWRIPDPQGNFVWLPLAAESARFAEACEAVGVAVRGFPGEGVRVSIGEPEACDRVLEVAARPGWGAAGDGS